MTPSPPTPLLAVPEEVKNGVAVAVASKERHGDSQALVDTVNVPLQLFMPLRVLEGRVDNELTPVPLPLPVDVTLPYLDTLHAPLPEAVPVGAGE